MPVHNRLKVLIAISLFCLTCNLAISQVNKHGIHHQKVDSNLMELNSRISDSILRESEIKDTTIPVMVNKIESYSLSLNRAENFFDRRFDTSGILKSITDLERRLIYFHNLLIKNEKPLNLRNLNTATVILNESGEKLEDWEHSLATYITQLNSIHERIRNVNHDSSLLNDSIDIILHGQMKAAHERSLALDSLLHITTVKIYTLRNRVSINYLLLKDLQSEIADREQGIRQGIWNREDAPLFESRATDYDSTLWQLIQDTLGRSLRVIRIFMTTTWDTRTINLVIWLLFMIWFLFTLQVVRKKINKEDIFKNLTFLNKSAILASLLLLVTYGPFLYDSAPAVYIHSNEIFRLLFLSILLNSYFTRPGKIIWLLISIIWIGFGIDDLLLDAAYGERWGLLIFSVALSGVSIFLLRKNTIIFKSLEESGTRNWVIRISLIQICISILANLTGRLTLSKLLAFSAINSLVFAMTLQVCCTILIDAVYTQTEVYHNRFFAFLNFVDLKNKLRKVLWVVAIGAWMLSILRNLILYDKVSSILLYFINKPRSIGSITFSFTSGVLFILIIWISSVLSQFVNFFFNESQNPGPFKKTRLGSIALLVRVGIWTAGFLIAAAAAGIPINKITILIGALGVGIGFGLQNLVNNLVSGIIIAFERPIQIGDTIEISGKTGIVQEIGVRSSQISNGEGANIIIPNGDLLSQQLINWTLHNRNKRVKVNISVPYKSDFRMARDLIMDEINKNSKIMRDPKPAVTVDTFANTMVNFEIKFWVPDMSEVGDIRNELMLNILESFSKKEIPIT